MAEINTLTGYEPNFIDKCQISETTVKSPSRSLPATAGLRKDLEYDDYTIGMALSSPLFTQEREDAASRRRACHSPDEGLSSSQSSSVGHRTVRQVVEHVDSQISNVRENPRRDSENEQIRVLLERQRANSSLIIEQRFKNTNFRPIMTEEVFKS